MKNLTNSSQLKPHGFQLNSQGGQLNAQGYELGTMHFNVISALANGLQQKFEDWVALELTAEQMIEDGVVLVCDYVVDDAKYVWRDLQEGFLCWEYMTADFLLGAADPARLVFPVTQYGLNPMPLATKPLPKYHR
jgi:hypothetical protein